jgi:hypothetical protein
MAKKHQTNPTVISQDLVLNIGLIPVSARFQMHFGYSESLIGINKRNTLQKVRKLSKSISNPIWRLQGLKYIL